MSFVARFLGWSLLLGLPAWAWGDGYRLLLARALEGTLAIFGQRVELQSVDATAPTDLALFAALTLASDAWSWRRRLAALAIGIPALMAVELGIWTACLAYLMSSAASGRRSGTAEQMWRGALGAVAWLCAVSAWMMGPGAAMADRAGRRPPAPRAGPGRPSMRAGRPG